MTQNNNGEERRYTYPEILKRYFPNATDEDLLEEDVLLSRDDFFDILAKVTLPTRPDPKKTKTLA